MKGNTRKPKAPPPPAEEPVKEGSPPPLPGTQGEEVSAVLFTPHLEEESEETSESIEVSEQEAVLQSPVARVLAYRVNCDTCGTPINPKWPECPVCGGKFYVPAEKAHYEGIDAALQKHRRAGQ